MKKTNLGLLFGGRSCEHEVSVISARSISNAIDRGKYDVFLIGIDKAGHWKLNPLTADFESLLEGGAVKSQTPHAQQVTLALHQHGNIMPAPAVATTPATVTTPSPSPPTPSPTPPPSPSTPPPPSTPIMAPPPSPPSPPNIPALDVIFPALHGTFGEDGTIQGVCEMAGIPYVGCGVAASAIALDKSLAKKIFGAAGIPQAAHIDVSAAQWRARDDVLARAESLKFPLFIKPASLGSSVGISKVHARAQLQRAIDEAFCYDNKIVIETSMENCIEVECAVLGNAGGARASIVGEIAPGAEFYDYAAKYIHDSAELVAPARIPESTAGRVRELSLIAFDEIGGAGLARADFFVHRETWEVTLNEINTLPGFTPISMYPRLWRESGMSYAGLIDRLIELAFESHRAKLKLQRAFTLPASK